MFALAVLVAPLLGACLGVDRARPVDIEVEALVELPDFEPDTQIQFASYSTSKSAAAYTSFDPDCLVDPGYCKLSFDVSGLGRARIDSYVWLDVDGNDGGDLHKALVDDDLLGYLSVNVPSLPYDPTPVVELNFPEIIIDAE